jgi:hypothetical protein
MSIPPAWPEVLDFFGTPLVLEPSPGQLSGDAGLLSDSHPGIFFACFRTLSIFPTLPGWDRWTECAKAQERCAGKETLLLEGREDNFPRLSFSPCLLACLL